MVAERIPVLIVSGFLGSGKTTLVRWLLEDARAAGERIAVVSNEFGELGIDRALLGEGDGAFVELEGGCVCCQLGDDLLDTLQTLHERVQPSRVIIETSGVALPYDVQLNLYREPVCGWVGDDVTAVVVDAELLASGDELDGTFTDQVTSADLLVLNKLDLVDAAVLEQLEARLRELEPDAPVLRCVRGRVDPRVLFAPAPGAREHPVPGAPHPHSHEAFETSELRVEGVFDVDALRERLRGLGALRVKGFVCTPGGVRLVQGVGPRIELEPAPVSVDDALVGRLVLIRRAIPGAERHDGR